MSNAFLNKQAEDTSQIFLQSCLNNSDFPVLKEECSIIIPNEPKQFQEHSIRGGDNRRSRLFQVNEQYQPQKLNGFIMEANEVLPTIEFNDQDVQFNEIHIPLDNLKSNHDDENEDVIISNMFQMAKKSVNTPIAQNITSTTIAPIKQFNLEASPHVNKSQHIKKNFQNSPHQLQQSQFKNSERNLDKYNKSLYNLKDSIMDRSSFSPINSAIKGRRVSSYEVTFSFFKIIYIINRFLFHVKKVLLFFHPEKLNAFQLQLIGDNSAQSYDQDQYGVPYHLSEQQKVKLITQTSQNSSKIEILQDQRTHNFSQFQSITIHSNEHARQKRNKRMRIICKKIYKYMGINLLSRVYTRLKQRMRRIAKSTIDKIPLINPHSHIYYLWQSVILFCDTIVMIYIPFQASFTDIVEIESYFFKIAFPIIYTFNILVNMNVSVYDKGILITSRSKIIQLYLQQCFVFDAFAVFAAFTKKILYLIRFLYTNPLIDQLKSYFLLNSNFNAMIQLASLVIKIFVFSHIFSCVWHVVGSYYYKQNKGWMFDFGYNDIDIKSMYITCFYYAVVTMSTIGYGDIYAKTMGEMIFMIFSILISSCLFGYTLNSIGTILTDLRYKNENYSKKQAQLEEYLSRHQVDVSLRNRARKYIQYVYQQENMFKKDGQENLKLLNSYLKQEIQKDINKKAFSKAKKIFQNISNNPKFFENILQIIKEQSYGPEELISIPNSSQHPSIYIVQFGEVELFIRSRDSLIPFKTIQVIKTGSVFGQQEFFTNNQINYLCARSIGLSYISYIPLEEFQLILNEFPEEKEKFYSIRDQVLINKQNYLVQDICLSCKADHHSLLNCPYIFYNPSSQNPQKIPAIANKFNKEEIQRIQSKLRQRKKYYTKKTLNYLQTQVKQFQDNQTDVITYFVGQFDDLDAIEGTQQGFEQSFLQMKEEEQQQEGDNLLPVLKQGLFSESRKRSLSNVSRNNTYKLLYPQQVGMPEYETLKQQNLQQQAPQNTYTGSSFQIQKDNTSPQKGSIRKNSSSRRNNTSDLKKSSIGLLAEIDKNLQQSLMTFENKMMLQAQETKEVVSNFILNDTSKDESEPSIEQQRPVSSPQQEYSKKSITLRDTEKRNSVKFSARSKKRSFTNFNERLIQKDFVLEDMISKNKAILNNFTEISNKNIQALNQNTTNINNNSNNNNSNNNNNTNIIHFVNNSSGNINNSNNNNNNLMHTSIQNYALNNQSPSIDKRYNYLQYTPSTNIVLQGNAGFQQSINLQQYMNFMQSSGSNYKNQMNKYKSLNNQQGYSQILPKSSNQSNQMLPNFTQQFSTLTLPNMMYNNNSNNKNSGDFYLLPEDIQTTIERQIKNIVKYTDKFHYQGQETMVSMHIDQLRNYQVYFPQNNFDKIVLKLNEKLKGKKTPYKKPRKSKHQVAYSKDQLLL